MQEIVRAIPKAQRVIKEAAPAVKKVVTFVDDFFGNMMRKVGGGERAIVRTRQASPELVQAKNVQKGAKASHDLAAQRYKEAQQAEEKVLNNSKNWKQPNSKRNVKRVNDAAQKTDEAERNAINASQRSREAKEAFNNTKKQVTEDARRQIRNKGIKRTLKTTGVVGGLGAGTYLVIPRDSSNQSTEQQKPSQYKYDQNNGWQEYNEQTGQYEAQKPGFGIDRFGNTNYYNGSDWLNPDQYIQGSNGYVYDKATGQIIGNSDDMLEARNSGYNNIFDWRAAQAGFNSPEQVKALQQQLGITADGKWGQQTQNAYEKVAQALAQQYDPSSLFSIYQKKLQLGY